MTSMTSLPPSAFNLAGLPASCRFGRGVQIFANKVSFSEDVTIGDDVTIVADNLEIGSGTTIAAGADLRSSTLRIGDGCEIQRSVSVIAAERFEVGDIARICAGVSVVCRDFKAGRLFYFGEGGVVGMGGTTTSTAVVAIGDRVTISQFAILNSNCLIEIGDNVGTGSYLAIWTHGYHFGHGPLEGSQPAYAPVRVARNAWLGFQVTLLPGVTVGENTIVAAGSVVTTAVPADVLVGGVPARVKKSLDRKPVTGQAAVAAVVEALRVWETELDWKGYRVLSADYRTNSADLVICAPDGSQRTRVILVPDDAALPAPSNEYTVTIILSVEDRSELRLAAGDSVVAFSLRTGFLYGGSTQLSEDLRNQLRRYAMPCGDTRPFTSIEPPSFSRLRAATTAVPR